MIDHPIVGSWALQEWVIEYPDGRRSHPFGTDAHGRLIYTPQGQMLCAISAVRSTRSAAVASRQAGAEAKSAAYDDYFSYGGRYQIDGDDVHHHVDMALNPAFVGSTQIRHMQFEGDSLRLQAREDQAGISRLHTLRWVAITQ